MNQKVIMFQGDSITDVGRSRDVEADKRPNTQLGGGYPGLVAARLLRDHAAGRLQFHTANQWQPGGRSLCTLKRHIEYKPDIISILIGVNDTWHEAIKTTPMEWKCPLCANIPPASRMDTERSP